MQSYEHWIDSTVEIAHIYAPELAVEFSGQWRQEHNIELPVFAPPSMAQERIRFIAQNYSRNPVILSLVDDIASNDPAAILMTDLSVIDAVMPDDVYRESEYIDNARMLINQLQNSHLPDGYRLNAAGSKLVVGTGKTKTTVSLTGFRGVNDPTHPSCEMLDAAWILDRLQSVAPRGANILPLGFRPQQERTREIANVLPQFSGYDFKSLFVHEQGWVVDTLDWQLGSLALQA